MNGKLQPLERVKWGVDNYRMRNDYCQQFVAQGMTLRQARERCDEMFPPNVWENDEYQVIVHQREEGSGFLAGCSLRKLSIQRRDGEALQDWRDLQAIKNQICGPEYEAVELYPQESRVVDTQNQFHLYVLLSFKGEQHPQFPFGGLIGDKARSNEPVSQRERFDDNPAPRVRRRAQ